MTACWAGRACSQRGHQCRLPRLRPAACVQKQEAVGPMQQIIVEQLDVDDADARSNARHGSDRAISSSAIAGPSGM